MAWAAVRPDYFFTAFAVAAWVLRVKTTKDRRR